MVVMIMPPAEMKARHNVIQRMPHEVHSASNIFRGIKDFLLDAVILDAMAV